MPLTHDDTAIERWADPPPTSRGGARINYDDVVTTLRRRPRTWALVWESVSTGRASGLKKACPQLDVCSRIRQVDGKDRADVYARYIPKPVEAVS